MAKEWIGAFGAALQASSASALSELFIADSHWRNIFGLSWQFATISGVEPLVAELLARAAEVGATEFRIDAGGAARRARRWSPAVRSSRPSSALSPSTDPARERFGCLAHRTGSSRHGRFPRRSISTGSAKPARTVRRADSHARDFAAPDWLEQRSASSAYSDREPDVLIVGGGHAGISAAVELKRIGLDALVIDRQAARRRQLASSLPRPETPQQDAGQSSALSAVPGDLSGLHPEGPDRELARKLRRHHRGRFLDGNEFEGAAVR